MFSQSYPLVVVLVSKKRYLMQFAVDFGSKYIYRNPKNDGSDNDEHQQVCSDHMDNSMKHFSTKLLLLSIGFFTASIPPMYR